MVIAKFKIIGTDKEGVWLIGRLDRLVYRFHCRSFHFDSLVRHGILPVPEYRTGETFDFFSVEVSDHRHRSVC